MPADDVGFLQRRWKLIAAMTPAFSRCLFSGSSPTEDCDVVFTRAVDAGAKVLVPLEDKFAGTGQARFRIRSGQRWSIMTHEEE